jgi:hypothetical protein
MVIIDWLDEGSILRVRFSGQVDLSEFHQAIQECLSRMVTQQVHFLIDLGATTTVDPQVIALPSLSQWVHHPNGGWHVYVQPPRVLDRLMAVRMAGSYRSFATQADALDFLQMASVRY